MHALADETCGFLQPAMNNLAYLLEKHVKQYDEAEQLYRQALDIEPHNVILLCNLAGVFPSLFPALFPTLPLYLLMWQSGLYPEADARLAVWRASTDDICLGMLRTRRLSVQRERAV